MGSNKQNFKARDYKADYIDEPLSRYEGMHVLHFETENIEMVHERLMRQSVSCSEIRPYQRPVETPDGFRMMSAKTLHFPAGANPEALLQVAQHDTPELVLQPRFMRHRNGAKALTEAIVCTTDPAGLAAKYALYSGKPQRLIGYLQILDLGQSRVVITSPEHLAEVVPDCVPQALPFLVGFTVATTGLDTTRQVLNDTQIPFREHSGRLVVHPSDACGSAVIFEEEGATLRP